MDLFEEQKAIRDKMEEYSTVNIPENLSWDKTGPIILKGIEKRKKRRRLIIWWWGIAIGLIGISVWIWKANTDALDPNFSSSKLTTTRTLDGAKAEKPMAATSKNNIDDNQINKEDQLSTVEKIVLPQAPKVLNTNQKQGLNTKSSVPLSVSVDTNTVVSLDFVQDDKMQLSNNALINDELVSKVDSGEFIPYDIENLLILSNPIPEKSRRISVQLKQKNTIPKWQLEVTGGINWWQQNLMTTNAIDSINTPLIGWQVNARVKRYFGKYWTITTGLQLQNLRYKSAFKQTDAASIFQPRTIDAIFQNTLTGEQTVTYRDSIPGLRTRNFQHFNQHTSLQIPILVGLNFGKGRWKYALQTGIGLQFLQFNSGRIALETSRVTDLPDKTLYNDKIRFSYLLEAQLSYKINDKLSVLGRLSMENHLTNWLSSDTRFQQRPSIRHSSLGLAWSF